MKTFLLYVELNWEGVFPELIVLAENREEALKKLNAKDAREAGDDEKIEMSEESLNTFITKSWDSIGLKELKHI